MANKLDMKSMDIKEENIRKIGKIFPNCVAETEDGLKIDYDILKQELSNDIVEGNKEKYQLTWAGKNESVVNAYKATEKTLRPLKDKSVNFDETENVYIEGDNLETLKILLESYLNKIKVIYIDPPYNTGKDFVYNDEFSSSEHEELKNSGRIDEDGNLLVSKDINSISNGKYHSNWLNMIYPRIKLARNLLQKDGVMFISIDDNEYMNMRSICDEIFGRNNYIDTFYIQVRYTNKSLNEKDDFQKVMEQVLIYAKDKSEFKPNKPQTEYDMSKFKYKINELQHGEEITLGGKKVEIFKPGMYEIVEEKPSIKGLKATWASGSVLKGNTSGKFFDKQLAGRKGIDGINVLYKVYGIGEDGLGYRYFTGPKKKTATKGQFYSGIPVDRIEELTNGSSIKEHSIVNYYDFSGDFGNIRNEGDVDFRSGKKPVKMIKMFLDMIPSDDYICMDFFSGSASTAHAVMQKNAEDDGKRKFIMIQIPEKIDENQDYYRAGFKNICDIGQERIKRAGKKINEESDIDYGFRVFKTDTSNMRDVYYEPSKLEQTKLNMFESSIKEDRTQDDLLIQVILNLGLTLDLKIEEKNILDNKVFYVANNMLVACFDDKINLDIIDKICEKRPTRIVFKESSFNNDNDKMNTYERIRKLSPETQVSII